MMVAAAALFVLFSLGMIKARTQRQALAVVLAGSVAAMVVAPRPARAQGSLIGAIRAVLNVINGVIHTALASVESARNAINQFYQLRLWPQQLINQARGMVTQMIAQYRNRQIQTVTAQPVVSATLPAPQQLEQNLLSANSAAIPNTSADYTAVYGAVPPSAESSPQVRNMVDMGDAVAEDAMKRAIEIDNLSNLELQAAAQLNQAIQNAAPGSAPIIEAQADAWLVRANAYTQAATADLMRVRAVGLANQGENMKLGAAASSAMVQKLENLLK